MKKKLTSVKWVCDTGDGYKNDTWASSYLVPEGMDLQKEVDKIKENFAGTDLEDEWSHDDIVLELEKVGVEPVSKSDQEVWF